MNDGLDGGDDIEGCGVDIGADVVVPLELLGDAWAVLRRRFWPQ